MRSSLPSFVRSHHRLCLLALAVDPLGGLPASCTDNAAPPATQTPAPASPTVALSPVAPSPVSTSQLPDLSGATQAVPVLPTGGDAKVNVYIVCSGDPSDAEKQLELEEAAARIAAAVVTASQPPAQGEKTSSPQSVATKEETKVASLPRAPSGPTLVPAVVQPLPVTPCEKIVAANVYAQLNPIHPTVLEVETERDAVVKLHEDGGRVYVGVHFLTTPLATQQSSHQVVRGGQQCVAHTQHQCLANGGQYPLTWVSS